MVYLYMFTNKLLPKNLIAIPVDATSALHPRTVPTFAMREEYDVTNAPVDIGFTGETMWL